MPSKRKYKPDQHNIRLIGYPDCTIQCGSCGHLYCLGNNKGHYLVCHKMKRTAAEQAQFHRRNTSKAVANQQKRINMNKAINKSGQDCNDMIVNDSYNQSSNRKRKRKKVEEELEKGRAKKSWKRQKKKNDKDLVNANNDQMKVGSEEKVKEDKETLSVIDNDDKKQTHLPVPPVDVPLARHSTVTVVGVGVLALMTSLVAGKNGSWF